MKKTFVADLTSGGRVDDLFVVASKQLRDFAKGQFLSMVLGDRTGTVNAVVWDDAEATSRSLKEGDLDRVVGAVGTYNGGPQIKVERIGYDKKQADLSDFIESLENTQVEQQLRHLLATVADPGCAS
jgi:3'-5' exoribonuclease